MFNRVLLILLTSAATCGLSTAVIAQNSRASTPEWNLGAGTIVSQADGSTSNTPSAAIQSLQNRLRELGYYNGSTTGVFDDTTRAALAQFQQDQGLVGTGILDPLTQERLADPTGASSAPDAEDTSETSETPPAASPSLDLPPVSENGEALEPATAPTDAEAGAAGNNGAPEPSGEATVDSAADAAATPTDGNETPPAETETTEDGSFPILILAGALILVLGGIGGGVTLWLMKRGGQGSSESQPPSEPQPTNSRGGQSPSPHAASKKPPTPRPPSSGRSPNVRPVAGHQKQPQTALDVQHRAMPLGNVSEPRVAKVNIIDELIQDLRQPDSEVRRRAIWELGQRGNSAAMQPLVDLLTQVDSREQSLILAALAEITSQTLKPMNRAVMIALQSEDAEVRKNAIRDLTKIFDSFKQSGKMLGHAAIDEDPDVKQTADWALDQLNKMRPNSPTNTAGLLGESDAPQKRLRDDGTSSK